MEEFKNIIENAPNEMLNSFLAIYNELLERVPNNSPAYNTFSAMIMCIKEEMRSRGMSRSGGYVSDSMRKEAYNYLSNHGVNVGNNYDDNRTQRSSFVDGAIGLGVFILIIIAIAVVKGLFDIVVNLWNSGILKVILGLTAVGGGLFLGYKKGLFEKIKDKINEHKQNKEEEETEIKSESKNKEKTKSVGKEVASFTKCVVKDLVILSSTTVVLATGMAHLDKHTNVLDGTIFAEFGDECRFVYEYAGRFVREKAYEIINDYSEFENKGYMNYQDPYYTTNARNWNYENGDIYLEVKYERSWEWLASYCYGNSKFGKHLRLYNSRYDLSENLVHAGEYIFVPSPEKLEEYISEKRLIKK